MSRHASVSYEPASSNRLALPESPHLAQQRRDFASRSQHGIFKDLATSSMIRSYKGITPTIPPSCYVDESAQLIGDVVLGENASVWMNAVLRGDVHYIRVGANSNIQDCSVLHGMLEKWPVVVGDWVTVGHSVTLHGC